MNVSHANANEWYAGAPIQRFARRRRMRKMAFTAGSRRRTIPISGFKAFIYVKSPRNHIAQNYCHDPHFTRCKRGLCIGLQLGGTRQHVQRRSGLRSAERPMPRHHNLGRRSAQSAQNFRYRRNKRNAPRVSCSMRGTAAGTNVMTGLLRVGLGPR